MDLGPNSMNADLPWYGTYTFSLLAATLLFMASSLTWVSASILAYLLLAGCHTPVHGLQLDLGISLYPRCYVSLRTLMLCLILSEINCRNVNNFLWNYLTFKLK